MSAIIVFPGQGCQRNGMAQDFFDAHATARMVFEEASDALNMDMAKLCFEDDPRLGLTEFTQPAIVTAEIAMYRTLQEMWGLQGTYFGGHSLGEYAMVAANVAPLADAVKVVRLRGRRMQKRYPRVWAPWQPSFSQTFTQLIQHCLHGLQATSPATAHPIGWSFPAKPKTWKPPLGVTRTPSGRPFQGPDARGQCPFHSRLMATIEPGFSLLDASTNWDTSANASVFQHLGQHARWHQRSLSTSSPPNIGHSAVVDGMKTLCALPADRVMKSDRAAHCVASSVAWPPP